MNSRFRIVLGDSEGFVLLDAVIAILIFSVGILGMVALQGSAIKLAGDAQYRTYAAMFADQVITQMWGYYNPTTDPSGAVLTAAYQTGGTQYTNWATTLKCTASQQTPCMPGVTATSNAPTIAITNGDPTGNSPSSLVVVTIKWQSANDSSPHSYVSVTQISR